MNKTNRRSKRVPKARAPKSTVVPAPPERIVSTPNLRPYEPQSDTWRSVTEVAKETIRPGAREALGTCPTEPAPPGDEWADEILPARPNTRTAS